MNNILRRLLLVLGLAILYTIIVLIILLWMFLFIPIIPIEYILFGTTNIIGLPDKALDNLVHSENKLKEKILKAKKIKKEIITR